MRAFALTDMVQWGFQGLRNVKPRVGEGDARGIPALHRAARLRAEAVAQLELCCWRGEGPTRERVETVWQARLFRNGPQPGATNPVQTRFVFWETVEESLAWRNNAFLWCNVDPASSRVVDWWALHPDQVSPRPDRGTGVVYDVIVASGYVDPVGRGPGKYRVGPDTILHIRGHGQGGQLLAPTPLEVFRTKLGAMTGRDRHEARMWRRGSSLQVAIEFPPGVNKEQADQWREVWRSNYEGTEGETTAVLGGGGQIKPIGMSQADAQWVETQHLTIEDASLIMAMPADMLGVQLQRTPEDKEQIRRQWLQDGLGPELARIEDALFAYAPLFGGSQTYPAFDTSNFVRGDLATESDIIQKDVQAGILLVDEARRLKGYGPLPGGVGLIPQVVPVGGSPHGVPEPAATPAEEPVEAAGPARAADDLLFAEMRDLRAELRDLRSRDQRREDGPRELHVHVPNEVELRQEPIVIPAPIVNVPEQRVPDVTVEVPAPVVNVDVHVPEQAPPVVNVTVPEQPAPVVNVTMPDDGPERKTVSVERGRNGLITGLTIEEQT